MAYFCRCTLHRCIRAATGLLPEQTLFKSVLGYPAWTCSAYCNARLEAANCLDKKAIIMPRCTFNDVHDFCQQAWHVSIAQASASQCCVDNKPFRLDSFDLEECILHSNAILEHGLCHEMANLIFRSCPFTHGSNTCKNTPKVPDSRNLENVIGLHC